MPLSTRVYPVLALLTVGLWSTSTACTTFSGIGDLGQGGAGGYGANAAQSGSGSPITSGNGAGNTSSGTETGSTSTSGSGSGSGAGATSSASSSSSGPGPGSSSASSSSAAASSSSSGPVNDAAQLCVNTINMYRATLGLPPYARWSAQETCATDQGMKDYQAMMAHSAFGQCGESAQNECPGWPGPPEQMITQCLAQMWAEGPGPFMGHGHYINMSSMSYTQVACGFYTTPQGKIWAVQDFK
jgi:hypothetical protein